MSASLSTSESNEWNVIPTKSNKSNSNKFDNTNNVSKVKEFKKSYSQPSDAIVNETKVYQPKGIIVMKIDKESKIQIRTLLPNDGVAQSDRAIFNFIHNLKSKMNAIDFKRRVIMIIYQAIKQDLGSLVELLINKWQEQYKYPIIEIMDSECDGCCLITQAAWSGSLISLKTIVSNGGNLFHINKKGETIIETIQKGKEHEISKDTNGKRFIEQRFNLCIDYISQSIQRKNNAANIVLKQDAIILDAVIPDAVIPDDNLEEILIIKSLSTDDLIIKIVEKYLEAQQLGKNYYDLIKLTVSQEIFELINNSLIDEGIDLTN